ncbi:MAG: AAA family ATPase [Bacteroidetes bacterium]|nr:AAA family ATPase [Bacteroidota bacterium]
MNKEDIKAVVPMEKLLSYYGRTMQGSGKKFKCLQSSNHTNGDTNPSATIWKDRLTCHSQHCFEKDDIFAVVGKVENLSTFSEQRAKIEEIFGLHGTQSGQKKNIVDAYDYVDEQGNLLFQTVRYQPKDFRQRRPDGNGGWIWNLKNTRFVLYRLPEIIHADSILILEGEKDVETAYSLGLPKNWAATCNPMGAGKWNPAFSECLRHKTVVLCPDQDEPGLLHIAKIANCVNGIAKDVRLLRLPSGKDLTAWVEKGGTAEVLHQLIETAKSWMPEAHPAGFRLTSMADLLNEPDEETEWLVENLLPSGGLSVIGGKPKAGKSTTVRNLCLSISRGEPFLGFRTTLGPVFYCAFEEKRGEVKKHFRVLGATPDDQVFSFIGKAPKDFLEEIDALVKTAQPKLIVLDTLAKVTSISDMNDYAKVNQAIDPFIHLARQSGAHLMLVHHNGKGDRDGGDNLLGSTAIFGSVDTCLIQKRSDKYRTLQSINRYGIDLEETVLEWDEESKAISLGGSRKDTEVKRFEEEIIAFLKSQEVPALRELIEESIEGRTGLKRSALKNLVEREEVERHGKGGKGDPFKYSCFVVPHNIWVQGNKNAKNDETDYKQRADACSHELIDFEQVPNSQEHEIASVRAEKNGEFEEIEL